MTPADMRELAKWHDAAADEFDFTAKTNPGSDKRVLALAAKNRRDSAKIIRFAADVLEQEMVGYADAMADICVHGMRLITKPTFGGESMEKPAGDGE